jgi:RNA polymerase sigma factor (sigma-70 family)
MSSNQVKEKFFRLEEARASVLAEGLRREDFAQQIFNLLRAATNGGGGLGLLEIRRKTAARRLCELSSDLESMEGMMREMFDSDNQKSETQLLQERQRLANLIGGFRIRDRLVADVERTVFGNPSGAMSQVERFKSEIVQGNLGLVLWQVNFHCRNSSNNIHREDAIQGGNIGLMRAVDRYDGKGTFATYAFHWIRAGITRELQHLVHGLVADPRLNQSDIESVRYARNILRQNGGDPSSVDGILECLRELAVGKVPSQRHVSVIVAKLESSGPRYVPLSSSVAEPQVRNSIHAESGDEERKVEAVLRRLLPKYRQVLVMLYGIGGAAPMTLEQIGNHFGISRQAASQRVITARRHFQEEYDAVKDNSADDSPGL